MIEFQADANDIHKMELPAPHPTFEKDYYLATFLLPADSACEKEGCGGVAHVGLIHLGEGQEKIWYDHQVPNETVAMIVRCEPFCTQHIIAAAIQNSKNGD